MTSQPFANPGHITPYLYNFPSSSLGSPFPTFQAAVTNVIANTGNCRVLIIGDSTSYGVGSAAFQAGNAYQSSWPHLLAALFNSHGIPSQEGLASSYRASGGQGDNRWTNTGSWAYMLGGSQGFGGSLTTTTGDVGAALTFNQPGLVIDSARGYFAADPVRGACTLQVGTGATVAVNTAVTAAPLVSGIATSGTTPAVNNVVVNTTNTSPVALSALELMNSTGSYLYVCNAGIGSSTTTNWVSSDSIDARSSDAFIRAFAPDLTIINLGINDAIVANSPTIVSRNITTIAHNAAISGDVLLTTNFISNQGYRTYERLYAQQLRANFAYPMLDLQARSANYVQLGWMNGDGVHFLGQAYSDLAATVFQALMGYY